MFSCYDLKQIPAAFTFQTWAITFRQASSLLQAGTDRNMQRVVFPNPWCPGGCFLRSRAAHQIYRVIHLTTPRNCSFLGSNPAEMTVEPQAYGRCDEDAQVRLRPAGVNWCTGDQSCYRRCRSMMKYAYTARGRNIHHEFWVTRVAFDQPTSTVLRRAGERRNATRTVCCLRMRCWFCKGSSKAGLLPSGKLTEHNRTMANRHV